MNKCIIREELISTIPVLFVYSNTNRKNKIIFLFHPLLLNKTSELPLAFRLAKEGYFVTILDTHCHGDRQQSFETTGLFDFNLLYRTAYETAKDVSTVIEYMCEQFDFLDYSDLTCIGASNGANIAMMAGYLVENVTKVGSLIGTLNWEVSRQGNTSFKMFTKQNNVIEYDNLKNDVEQLHPVKHYKELNKLPRILIQNGMLDTTMGIVAAEKSFKELLNIYHLRNQENMFLFKKYPKTGHNVTEIMINDLVEWLNGGYLRTESDKTEISIN